MTMLDRMRRHKGWLKWSLGLVAVTFILLYIPDFLSPPSGGFVSGEVIATVDGRQITAGHFQQVYYQQLQAYRTAYGGNISDDLLRQLGLDQRLLQQMIDEEAALAEAAKLGIAASNAELRERILTMPAFQENGQFIGDARYRQLLQLQRPPMRPAEFEEQLRRSLVLEKLRAAITEWMTVSDAEVDDEYRRRNEQVKLELVAFTADKFRQGVTATDEEITAHFEAGKERYRIPEKRKVRYVTIDVQAMRKSAVVSPADVQRYYDTNLDQYSTPEEVHASHILLKTEGKDEAAIRKTAEELLAKARAGADFAELAKQFSEDEASAAQGGDLGSFGRDRMVPEFEEAAFSLEPGTISDLVRTQYGFHIIKVIERREAVVQPLDAVRSQIEEQLTSERAQTQAQRLAEDLAAEIRRPADVERVGQRRGLPVAESGFFDREEPIAGLGFAPEVNAWAFQLGDDEVSPPVRTSQGFAVIAVAGRQDSYLPALDEVKERVREDVIVRKALAAARERAADVAASAVKTSMERAAKAAGVEVKTTELVPRGTALPEIGISAEVDKTAFAMQAGDVSAPIETATASVVARVVERKAVTAEEVGQNRDSTRQQLLADRRNRFFAAYMTKAKQQMQIDINFDAVRQIVA